MTYYQADGISLHHADCVELLASMPDDSVSLIVTDPPYYKVKADWWDHQWDKPAEFLAWFGGLCDQWRRVLQPNGSLYVFASPQMAWHVEGEVRQRFNVLTNIRWRKPPFSTKAEMFDKDDLRAPFPASESIILAEQSSGHDDEYKYSQGKLHADIMQPIRDYLNAERERAGLSVQDVDRLTGTAMASHWFTHPTQWTLPTKEWYEKLRSHLNGINGSEYLRREYEDLRREYEDLRRPFNASANRPYTDVWDFATVSDHPGKHPCQKPLAMMEHIIETSTRADSVVLDCFAGSGVVGRAARNYGRTAILCETDADWCRRIAEKLSQQQLAFDTD